MRLVVKVRLGKMATAKFKTRVRGKSIRKTFETRPKKSLKIFGTHLNSLEMCGTFGKSF